MKEALDYIWNASPADAALALLLAAIVISAIFGIIRDNS